MNTNDGLRGPSDAWGLRRGGDLGFDVHELGIRSLLRHSLSIYWSRMIEGRGFGGCCCGFKRSEDVNVLVLPSVVTGGAIHDSITLNRDHSPCSNNPKSGKALGRVGIPRYTDKVFPLGAKSQCPRAKQAKH